MTKLEIRRKVLEIERLQWELQKDKYQKEIRWAYEVRQLQYNEQKIKRNLVENGLISNFKQFCCFYFTYWS